MANETSKPKSATGGLSDLAAEDIAYVGAHRERQRLFEALGNQSMDDETRKETRKLYVDASKNFDTLRAKLVKP